LAAPGEVRYPDASLCCSAAKAWLLLSFVRKS
jgi:hypothetical protein